MERLTEEDGIALARLFNLVAETSKNNAGGGSFFIEVKGGQWRAKFWRHGSLAVSLAMRKVTKVDGPWSGLLEALRGEVGRSALATKRRR